MRQLGYTLANTGIGMIIGAMIQAHNSGDNVSLWWLLLPIAALFSINSDKFNK